MPQAPLGCGTGTFKNVAQALLPVLAWPEPKDGSVSWSGSKAPKRFGAERHKQWTFNLPTNNYSLRKSLREFAEREILPNVMKWDEANHFPSGNDQGTRPLGVLGMIFPAEYGGAGMGYVEYVIAIEELSRVDGSVGIIVAAHNSLCSNHIFLAGNEEQKRNTSPSWPPASGWAHGD